MSKHITSPPENTPFSSTRRRVLQGIGGAATGLLGGGALSLLERPAEACSGTPLLFVQSNDARPNQNSIFAFRRDKRNGNLTPIPGSPFLSGGTGEDNPTDTLGVLDADQDFQVSEDRKYLFAPNARSNTISVFRIHPDGTLQVRPEFQVPSGGPNPISVGLAPGFLIAVNKNEDDAQSRTTPPNYRVFRRVGGRLTPVNGGVFQAPFGSAPSQAHVSPNGRVVFCVETAFRLSPVTGPVLGEPCLRTFTLTRSGHLMQAPGSPFSLPNTFPNALPPLPPLPPIPLGVITHPRLPFLYSGVVSSDQLATFRYDEQGTLQFSAATVLTGRAVCWLVPDRRGTQLYAVNTLTTSVSRISLADPARPVEVQHLVLNGPGEAINLALCPKERFLYVLSRRNNGFPIPGARNEIHVLAIGDDGSLSEAPFSPIALPAGDYIPKGIVVL